MKYECNTDQRHVNEPKTGHDATRCDPKKDRMLKHDCFPLRNQTNQANRTTRVNTP